MLGPEPCTPVTVVVLMYSSSWKKVTIRSPLSLADRRFVRGAEVDDAGFGRLCEPFVDDPLPVHLLGVVAVDDGDVRGGGGVAAGAGGDGRGVVVDRHVDVGDGRERNRERGV